MKRWLMLFTAVIAISLVSGCKQDTSDDNYNNGGYIGGGISGGIIEENETGNPAITFVEGWWHGDFRNGNKVWVKYNAKRRGIKCLTQANNSDEIMEVTEPLQPNDIQYTWDKLKKYAEDVRAKRFVHIEESEVPSVGSPFVEGWWQCDFQAGNHMWVKYNAGKIGVKCLTKANNSAEVTDVSNTLRPDAFYYSWDTMKKFAHDSNAKRFVHIEESEVPNVSSGGSGTGGGGSSSGGGSSGGGSGSGSGSGGSDETNPAAVAGWYKIFWTVPSPTTILYLRYNSSGKLERIGTATQETSINTITSDYGEYANSLKKYDNKNPFLKDGKITNPAQWPSWAK